MRLRGRRNENVLIREFSLTNDGALVIDGLSIFLSNENLMKEEENSKSQSNETPYIGISIGIDE